MAFYKVLIETSFFFGWSLIFTLMNKNFHIVGENNRKRQGGTDRKGYIQVHVSSCFFVFMGELRGDLLCKNKWTDDNDLYTKGMLLK